MSNNAYIQEDSKIAASKLFNLFIDDLRVKISHVDNRRVLDELRNLAFMKSRNDILKIVDDRINQLNG